MLCSLVSVFHMNSYYCHLLHNANYTAFQRKSLLKCKSVCLLAEMDTSKEHTLAEAWVGQHRHFFIILPPFFLRDMNMLLGFKELQ